MRKYIKLSEMSQASREKYQAKRARINANPVRMAKEQQRLYLRHGKKWSLDPATVEICVIDGEADDQGHYNLFQVFSPSIGTQSLRAGSTGRLGIFECMRFLKKWRWKITEKTGKQVRFLAFAYGYDVNQQLHGETQMTDDEKLAVWHMRSRSWGVVRGPHWSPELEIESANASLQIGRKTGYVKFHRDAGKSDVRIAWQDMFTLFAKSFVKSVGDYAKFWTKEEHDALDGELAAVIAGKEARGKWEAMGYSPDQIALKYQEPELKLMHWLATKVITLCKEVELYPKSLAGPAPIARALDRKYGVTSHIRPRNYEEVEFQESKVFQKVRAAFFGGNIQNAYVGLVSSYHSYDLSSAHPAQITKLPCGAHGEWVELDSGDLTFANGRNPYPNAIYHIIWNVGKDVPYGPFPVRRADNSTHYPLRGEGDYHTVEISAFFESFPNAQYDITEGIQWVSHCKIQHPFEKMITDTYEKRNVYKKEKNPAGNILKLGMNANFGIRAQTAGSHRVVDEEGNTIKYSIPKSSNLFLAGQITAGTRAMVMKMVAKDPKNVLGIATDAVKFRVEQDFDAVESEDKETDRPLGGLEHEHVTGKSYFVAPGVIFSENGESKIRGCPSSSTWWTKDKLGELQHASGFAAIAYALERKLPSIYCRAEKYQSPFDMGTLPENVAKFIPVDREILVGPIAVHTKRDPCGILEVEKNLWYLPPYQKNPDGPSKAYTRPMDIGAKIFEREEEMES